MRTISPLTVVVGLALSASVVGCDSVLGPEDIAGTYALITVDDEPLPYRINFWGGGYIEITSSSFHLRDESTFSLTLSVRSSDTSQNATVEGTYTMVEDSVYFEYDGEELDSSGLASGSINGRELTMVGNDGIPWVYAKT
jgi:hypothetical protein